MTIAPSSDIYLLKAPFELDNYNQLTFSNATTQNNYFKSLPKLFLDNATYQRKDGVIRYPTNTNVRYEDLLKYNYCMYKNENYSNKWFYAYIDNVTYENDGMSLISLKTDVFQTWQFDINYRTSFIEREHVNNDTVGLHTIPEGLETGEFICNEHVIDDAMDNIMSDLVYVLSTSADLRIISAETDNYVAAKPTKYNGIVAGVKYYVFTNPQDIADKLTILVNKGQIDVVNGLFMAPVRLCPVIAERPTEIASSDTPQSYTNVISKQTSLNGYTPKNKKLLTGDYNYLLVSNNNGNSVVMKYEDFSQNNCSFKIDMALTPGCSIRMIPTNYKTISEADEYGINMGKLPICSYPVDMYTNWLTQNSVNVMGMQVSSDDLNMFGAVVDSVMSLGSSIVSKDVVGGISSASSSISNIGNAMITKKQHDLIPPQSRGNLNGGDVITASNKNNFQFYKMSIRAEYAKIIDNYFSMFGYKVNDVKTPNITGRQNWNYVKTINCNFTGDIPQNDMQEIKQIFNNGVTLWHNANTFLDYSQSNNIV